MADGEHASRREGRHYLVRESMTGFGGLTSLSHTTMQTGDSFLPSSVKHCVRLNRDQGREVTSHHLTVDSTYPSSVVARVGGARWIRRRTEVSTPNRLVRRRRLPGRMVLFFYHLLQRKQVWRWILVERLQGSVRSRYQESRRSLTGVEHNRRVHRGYPSRPAKFHS